MPFADLVGLVVGVAYSVQVKDPGLFSDDQWTELQDRHLAQFEAFLEREHWDTYSQDESIALDDIKLAVHGDVHFQYHLDGFRTWLRRNVLKNDESSQHILFPHKLPGHLSPDELQFFCELRLGIGILMHLGDVHPQTGLHITYAPSRLGGRDGVPIRRAQDGGRCRFCTGDDSDGSGNIDGDFYDATDAVFSGDDDGFCSNDADSDSYEYVDQFDHYY